MTTLPHTIRVRRRLRREIDRTDVAFEQHVKKYGCTTDSAGCEARARFQERLAALRWALWLTGGRVDPADTKTTIQELPDLPPL